METNLIKKKGEQMSNQINAPVLELKKIILYLTTSDNPVILDIEEEPRVKNGFLVIDSECITEYINVNLIKYYKLVYEPMKF